MGTYRRTIGPVVEANSVVDFVFNDVTLPRSIKFCLNGIRKELAPLRHNEETLKLVDKYRRSLSRFKVEASDRQQLHGFIDRFQFGLDGLNEAISTTWFLPEQS